jgi:hypothetical protein
MASEPALAIERRVPTTSTVCRIADPPVIVPCPSSVAQEHRSRLMEAEKRPEAGAPKR